MNLPKPPQGAGAQTPVPVSPQSADKSSSSESSLPHTPRINITGSNDIPLPPPPGGNTGGSTSFQPHSPGPELPAFLRKRPSPRVLAIVGAALVVTIGSLVYLSHLSNLARLRPDIDRVTTEIQEYLLPADSGLKVKSIKFIDTKENGAYSDTNLEFTLSATESAYTAQTLHQTLTASPAYANSLDEINKLSRRADWAKLVDLIDPTDTEKLILTNPQILTEASAGLAGRPLKATASSRVRSKGPADLMSVTLTEKISLPYNAAPRSVYPDTAVLLNPGDHEATLATWSTAALSLTDKLTSAVELRRERLANETREFLAAIQSDTIFMGEAVDKNSGQKTPLLISIAQSDQSNQSLTLLLRNDGGWSTTREALARYSLPSDSEVASIKLSSNRYKATAYSGPIISTPDYLDLQLTFLDGRLFGSDRSYDYQLTLVAPEKRPEVLGAWGQAERDFLGKFASGSIFRLGVTIDESGYSEALYLYPTGKGENADVINADLKTLNGKLSRKVTFTVKGNKYADNAQIITLSFPPRQYVQGAPEHSLLGWRGHNINTVWRRDATGFASDFTYNRFGNYKMTLKPITQDEIAEITAKVTADIARSLQFLKPGSSFEGTASQYDRTESVVFKILRQTDVGGKNVLLATVGTKLNSVLYRDLQGSLSEETGAVIFQTTDSGAITRDGGQITTPWITSDKDAFFQLHIDADGTLKGNATNGWAVKLHITSDAEDHFVRENNSPAEIDPGRLPLLARVAVHMDGSWEKLYESGVEFSPYRIIIKKPATLSLINITIDGKSTAGEFTPPSFRADQFDAFLVKGKPGDIDSKFVSDHPKFVIVHVEQPFADQWTTPIYQMDESSKTSFGGASVPLRATEFKSGTYLIYPKGNLKPGTYALLTANGAYLFAITD